MKTQILFIALLFVLTGCASYHYDNTNYTHNRYFEQHEPYYRADNQHEAAKLVARKLGRIFKQMPPRSLAILDFGDEFGERSFRGSVFSDMIAFYLYKYRNPVVVKRGTVNELMFEKELTIYDLLDDRGYRLHEFIKADYILYGRIQQGLWDESISLRCFESGTGRVIFAATILNDRYDIENIFEYRPNHHWQHPYSSRPPHPGRQDRDDNEDDDDNDDDLKKKPSNQNGIENVGKKDLDKSKPSDSDQYQYKKIEKDDKESVSTNGSGVKKNALEDNNNVKKKSQTPLSEPIKSKSTATESEEEDTSGSIKIKK